MSFLSLTASAARKTLPITACTAIPLADDEREHEPEQGQRLDQADADEHGPPDHPRGFRLTGHGLHRLPHEDPDPDPGADGGEAVDQALADGGEASGGPGRLSQEPDHVRESDHP